MLSSSSCPVTSRSRTLHAFAVTRRSLSRCATQVQTPGFSALPAASLFSFVVAHCGLACLIHTAHRAHWRGIAEIEFVHYGPAIVAAASLYSACCRLSARSDESKAKASLFGLAKHFSEEQLVRAASFVPWNQPLPLPEQLRPFQSDPAAHTGALPWTQALLEPCIAQVDSLYLTYHVDPGSPTSETCGTGSDLNPSPVTSSEAALASMMPSQLA